MSAYLPLLTAAANVHSTYVAYVTVRMVIVVHAASCVRTCIVQTIGTRIADAPVHACVDACVRVCVYVHSPPWIVGHLMKLRRKQRRPWFFLFTVFVLQNTRAIEKFHYLRRMNIIKLNIIKKCSKTFEVQDIIKLSILHMLLKYCSKSIWSSILKYWNKMWKMF